MIVVLNLAWDALIEEDKDNLLQFAKVFPAKFLKLTIRQKVLPRQILKVNNSPKFYPATVLHYTVIARVLCYVLLVIDIILSLPYRGLFLWVESFANPQLFVLQ